MSHRHSTWLGPFIGCVLMTATTSHAAPTGRAFVNSLGLKMIEIKAESFDAWTPSFADWEKATEEVSGGLERPPVAHRVTLPVDYCLSEFPVTNAMYRQFLEATGHREPGGEMFDMDRIKTGNVATWRARGDDQGVESAWQIKGFNGDDQAVAGLNYHDAAAFCAWLSEKEGRAYRLPEVFEWEYACRADTDTLFHWGDVPNPRYLNFAGSRIGHPTPVGLYPPNPWGFYDMHGSVAECCEQIGRPGGVQKGGAWNYPGTLLGADVYVDVRGTFTPHMPITRRTMGTGFRIACDAGETAPRPGDLETPTVVAAGGTGPKIGALDIQVGEKMHLGKWHGGGLTFLVTQSGRWLLNDKRSDDQGKTWQSSESTHHNILQLRHGTIIAVDGPGNLPADGPGKRHVRVSTDDWKTVESFSAPIDIPLGKHFWSQPTGMCELEDGTLLLPLYGWMHGDQVRENNPMFPIADEAYKTRVILTKSTDRGRSWRYFSTICNHPEFGREGANETTIIQLPTGDLFAAMRTGLHGYVDPHGRHELDEPLLISWSRCGGAQWAEPERVYVDDKLVPGIWPSALLTEEGVLAILRTRGEPSGGVIFNPDGSGTVWTDQVGYERKRNGSMDSMALIGPNTILVTYIDVYNWHTDGTSEVIGLPITVRKKGTVGSVQ